MLEALTTITSIIEMNKPTLIALLVFSASLSGCKNKLDASAENFLQALNTTGRGQKVDVCVARKDPWRMFMWLDAPFSMTVGETQAHEKELQALVGVGILRVKETKLVPEKTELNRETGKQVEVKSYEVTEAGREFYLQVGDTKDLCYAQAIPAVVVKWEGPMQRGSHEVVDVTFKRKVGALAEWAKNEQVNEVFSVKQAIRQISEEEATATLKRTSEGWEAL